MSTKKPQMQYSKLVSQMLNSVANQRMLEQDQQDIAQAFQGCAYSRISIKFDSTKDEPETAKTLVGDEKGNLTEDKIEVASQCMSPVSHVMQQWKID